MSSRVDLVKIQEEIEKVESQSFARRAPRAHAIHLENLRRKYRRRASFTSYTEGIYLDLNLYKPETLLSQILHYIGDHHWLYYEAEESATYWMRICTICARREWTIFEWKKGPYKLAPGYLGEIELGHLREFLQGARAE